jgi:hypothetical protein
MGLVELLIIICANILSIFITAYLSQKGKNKAILEVAKKIARQTKLGENEAVKMDIEEISNKIKSVETAIIELSSKKQDKFFQLRSAITDFASDLTILVEWKFRIIPIGNDLFSPVEIRAKFEGFISHWAAVNSSFRKIMLFSNDDNEFLKQIHEQFLIIIKQFKITVEYYDVLLINSVIIGENNSPTLDAVKKMNDAQDIYRDLRDGSENVQKGAFNAYNVILQILNTRLMEKYNEK